MKNQSILVRVPGTVGNLGGAQNQAALALDTSLNLKATRRSDGHLNIRYFGENGERVPRDRTNLIARAFESALRYLEHEFSGVDFEVYSTIPVGFGLGSSTAAVLAGLVSANLLYELGLGEQTLLDLAGAFEPRSANLHAAWRGGLATHGGEGSSFERTRVSQEFGLIAVVPCHASQLASSPAASDNGQSIAHFRLASALAGYLSRPDSTKPSLGHSSPAGGSEDLLAIVKTLEAAGSASLASFLCGGGPAVGFLTRSLTPDSVLSVQEDLIRRSLARKVWSLRPANSGAQEWNDIAVTAPAPVKVGGEFELARAAHTTA